jgi:hypothetical protein
MHWSHWRRLVWVALFVTDLGYALAADAAPLPTPNGIIAFVRADGCPLDAIKSQVNAAGQTLAKSRATTFVAVDLAAYPDNNIDMFGNPSPYIAAVEANSAPGDVPKLVKDARKALGIQCKLDIFSVNERRLFSPARSWELGTPTPGGKGFTLLVRKDGTTPKFFYEQWSGPHVDLFMRREQSSQSPRSSEGKRYIHNYILARSKGSLPFDGIAEGAGNTRGPPTPESIKQTKAIAAGPPSSDVQKHAPVFMNMDKTQMFSVQEIILKD